MAKGSWSGIDRIVITGIGDDVVSTITSTNCITTEPNAAVGQVLSPQLPTWVTTPTVIYWISCSTREEPQVPPLCAIANAPVEYYQTIIDQAAQRIKTYISFKSRFIRKLNPTFFHELGGYGSYGKCWTLFKSYKIRWENLMLEMKERNFILFCVYLTKIWCVGEGVFKCKGGLIYWLVYSFCQLGSCPCMISTINSTKEKKRE